MCTVYRGFYRFIGRNCYILYTTAAAVDVFSVLRSDVRGLADTACGCTGINKCQKADYGNYMRSRYLEHLFKTDFLYNIFAEVIMKTKALLTDCESVRQRFFITVYLQNLPKKSP